MSGAAFGATTVATDDNSRRGGRFSRTAGGHEALDIAAEVARAAARPGEDPATITRARFDAQWKAMGSPGLSSQALRKRFARKAFSALLAMALAPAAERGFAARDGSTPQIESGMPIEVMRLCVKAAAHQLGRTPTHAMYAEWAERHAQARERAGGPPHVLPCAETLIARLGDWDRVLADAGLDPESVPQGGHVNPHTADVLDVLEDFLAEYGFLPPTAYFDDWCQRRDISVSRGRRLWSVILTQLRERRAAAGRWTPSKVTPGKQCPELPEQVVADRAARRRKPRRRLTEEDCLESLRIYGREFLPPGRHPTQKHYRGCAAGDARLVAPSSLQGFGKFQDLCRKAGI